MQSTTLSSALSMFQGQRPPFACSQCGMVTQGQVDTLCYLSGFTIYKHNFRSNPTSIDFLQSAEIKTLLKESEAINTPEITRGGE